MNAYTVILSKDPELGRVIAVVPAMPGALAECATRDEALRKIGEIMGAWLELAEQTGDGPLEESPHLLGSELTSLLEDRAAEGWDAAVELVPVHPAIAAAA